MVCICPLFYLFLFLVFPSLSQSWLGPPPIDRVCFPPSHTANPPLIQVNGELHALEALLQQAQFLVKPGGRLVVLSYHSLEDRRVKRVLATGNLQVRWTICS